MLICLEEASLEYSKEIACDLANKASEGIIQEGEGSLRSKRERRGIERNDRWRQLRLSCLSFYGFSWWHDDLCAISLQL
jgi:hypothetical protein